MNIIKKILIILFGDFVRDVGKLVIYINKLIKRNTEAIILHMIFLSHMPPKTKMPLLVLFIIP